MNLYTVCHTTPGGRRICKWAGSMAEAAALKAEAKKVDRRVRVEPRTVPTDKPGLLAWLNENTYDWEP